MERPLFICRQRRRRVVGLEGFAAGILACRLSAGRQEDIRSRCTGIAVSDMPRKHTPVGSEGGSLTPRYPIGSMHYHEVVILLYRPFIMPSALASSPPPTSLGISPAKAVQVCTDSAAEICRLTEVYRRHFGLARIHVYAVHILLTASLVHMYNASPEATSVDKEPRQHALTSMRALGELAQTFNSSTRALEVVNLVRVDWQDQMSRTLPRKRQSDHTASTVRRVSTRMKLMGDNCGDRAVGQSRGAA
jgi:hypothetical protein